MSVLEILAKQMKINRIVEVDDKAGFCFGVISAISRAEKELENTSQLFCLGDIVHNGAEVKRLSENGLKVITYEEFEKLKDSTVLVRAHGEPPTTYKIADRNNTKLIDATCPIVLTLQQKVEKGYAEMKEKNGQILIFGKNGHAEVIGLEGQTDNTALVITDCNDLEKVDFKRPIRLYSQTTKNKEEYNNLIEIIKQKTDPYKTDFIAYMTICSRMSNRADELRDFVRHYDIVIFVSGQKSSNGLYLYNVCKDAHENTHFITSTEDIDIKWFKNIQSVGITGATSTPMWLMNKVKEFITKEI